MRSGANGPPAIGGDRAVEREGNVFARFAEPWRAQVCSAFPFFREVWPSLFSGLRCEPASHRFRRSF
eukprot:15444912-Alexandrium_andersonii.AAC.1